MQNISKKYENAESTEQDLGYGQMNLIVIGILIGCLFDKFTCLCLITIWYLFRNKPLPKMFGGYRPQEAVYKIYHILFSYFNFLQVKEGIFGRFQTLPNNDTSLTSTKSESTFIDTIHMEHTSNILIEDSVQNGEIKIKNLMSETEFNLEKDEKFSQLLNKNSIPVMTPISLSRSRHRNRTITSPLISKDPR